jgi:hypothetical protein
VPLIALPLAVFFTKPNGTTFAARFSNRVLKVVRLHRDASSKYRDVRPQFRPYDSFREFGGNGLDETTDFARIELCEDSWP